jgi:hypothetical protein
MTLLACLYLTSGALRYRIDNAAETSLYHSFHAHHIISKVMPAIIPKMNP